LGLCRLFRPTGYLLPFGAPSRHTQAWASPPPRPVASWPHQLWKADYDSWSKVTRNSKAERNREKNDTRSQHKPAKKRKKIKKLKNSKQKLGRAKNKNSKPQAVSEAAKGHFEKPRAVTKENLCASSKRKLEGYRARDLEPQEGELANKNNEMFETILRSKLPEKLTHRRTDTDTHTQTKREEESAVLILLIYFRV
jgi:hypothetical protein